MSRHARAIGCLGFGVVLNLVAACADDGVSSPDAGAQSDSGLDAAFDARDDEDANVADDDGGRDQDAGAVDGGMDGSVPDASMCPAPTVQTHESLGGEHVTSNAGVIYNSNPPSSGPHCGSWGQYVVYSSSNPLPRCNYIHNLEHGGVVLLYKCEGDCPEITAALASVRDAAVDPECPAGKRVILTPDAELDTLIAAAAWQNTWTSDCIDASVLASLAAFIADNLGSAGLAPEGSVCSNGSITP